MHKTKKKSKTAKLPKPIKVKKEKSDEDRLPQPMTHYIDDRLEMVKQIFNSLKPKTIVNLAPDFLKTQALEEIEEACLNELLCISTKRLKSIITSTKCPTDTESSDNDSDVERQEEHISLEEISSDSEIEGSGSKKIKKKKSSRAGEESAAAKKDTANPDNPEDGQISVLELLELQARARAIRSQLALEPVTKIEVDSDGDKRNSEDKSKSSENEGKLNKNLHKRLSSERQSRDLAKVRKINGAQDNMNSKNTENNETENRFTKKIKLKRTHKSSTNIQKEEETQERQGSDKKVGTSKDGKERSNISKERAKSKNMENVITEIKKEKSSRSPSPDVIPIVAEPETLLITDSSDAENEHGGNTNLAKKTTKLNESISKSQTNMQRVRKNIETEHQLPQLNNDKKTLKETKQTVVTDNVSLKSSTENTLHCNTQEDTKSQDLENSNKKKSKTADDDLSKKASDETNSGNHSDDDQNDDVISLGGDLENEMNEQLENEVNSMQLPYNKKSRRSEDAKNKTQDESQPEETISLESSEDEHVNDNQSWHSRYMKSSKVSKVLAASRLGKRVRDKIKKTKHSKKGTSQENSDAEKEKSNNVFSSKHEDGSIEQYKELLEMRQRKSSQNNN